MPRPPPDLWPGTLLGKFGVLLMSLLQKNPKNFRAWGLRTAPDKFECGVAFDGVEYLLLRSFPSMKDRVRTNYRAEKMRLNAVRDVSWSPLKIIGILPAVAHIHK